jgi:hypothetical protein
MIPKDDFVLVEPIIEKMVYKISIENNITTLDAIDHFYQSQTYEMLITPELYLWDFSDKAIYDLWITEQRTGNPRNSVYITGGKNYE